MTSNSTTDQVEIFIIGGGINGCGIARDAVGRGYSVMLAEMNDLAQGTSSGSTKLIHGGLRYLEHYEFRLVREALIERERLWAMAPHIVWPLRFVLPHHSGLRPQWMLRLGLFMYDHLGGRKRLPATRTLDLTSDGAGRLLKPEFSKGFEYSDCWVDDARMVVLNARDAADRGAHIRTRTRVTAAEPSPEGWRITIQPEGRDPEIVNARLLVNAGGPWVDKVLTGVTGDNAASNVRLVQGSHIVVRKHFDHDRCYIFQNADDRIVFAIPYERDFTLIGTTDADFDGDPADAAISDTEITYLTEAVSAYFRKPVTRDDVVWTYAAVRPLYDDGASKAQEATRDYVLKANRDRGAAMVNIFGGKITTYRKLAEEVLEKIDGLMGRKTKPWTDGAVLNGGDIGGLDIPDFVDRLSSEYPFASRSQLDRLARIHGSNVREILSGASSTDDLGEDFGGGLFEAELRYLMEHEWVTTAEDALLRRTKMALHLNEAQRQRVHDWFDQMSATKV